MTAAAKPAPHEASDVVPEWDVIAGLRRHTVVVNLSPNPDDPDKREFTIEDVATMHYDLDVRKKKLEFQLRQLKDAGAKLLIKAEVKCVLVGDLRVTKIDGQSSRLDKKKLMRLAGKMGTRVLGWMAEATVHTPYTSLRVGMKKEEGESAGGEE